MIDQMTWSYSRIKAFDDCPYRFFLKYIYEADKAPKFFASYGSFMHKLIEQYYKQEITKEQMVFEFATRFDSEIHGLRPNEGTVKKYIKSGIQYLANFSPFEYKMLDVEKKVKFSIKDFSFVGIIDFLGTKNGELYLVDNKSRDLKPRSSRKMPTKNDKEIDIMLRQLYIYSKAIKEEYGAFPKALCFNCFKSGVFIKEPFSEMAYSESIEWAHNKIIEISSTNDFVPNRNYFSCRFICDVSDDCCYNSLEVE